MTAIAERGTFGLSGVRVGGTYELDRGDAVPGYTEGSFFIGSHTSERTLYQVTKGMVGVYTEDQLASRNPMMTSVIRPGERRSGLFGLETLDGGAFSGDAVALTSVEVQEVIFSRASGAHTAFLLTEAARERIRQEDFTSRLVFGDSKTRIAGALLDLAVVENSHLIVPVTQEEIGARAGNARETVNKEIDALETRGIVFERSRPLRVRDLSKLRRRAQYQL